MDRAKFRGTKKPNLCILTEDFLGSSVANGAKKVFGENAVNCIRVLMGGGPMVSVCPSVCLSVCLSVTLARLRPARSLCILTEDFLGQKVFGENAVNCIGILSDAHRLN